MLVGWLHNMLVYLIDGSAQTILRAATLRYKLQIQLSNSPSHSILTPGRLVPVLTLYRRAPGRVATGVPIFKSLEQLDPEKSRRKRDSNPGSSAPEADALTTRPTRRSMAGLVHITSIRPTHGRVTVDLSSAWPRGKDVPGTGVQIPGPQSNTSH